MAAKRSENNFLDYLKEEKRIQSEYEGIEPEEDLDEETPYDIQRIRVVEKPITIFQIEHWIIAGQLNLMPEYQRNLVWDQKRKSALIESLMLKIPLPSFYLDEDSNGCKNVIDGLQRLSAIHEFLNDEFLLKNLQYLSQYEGKTFSQLNLKFRSIIEDTVLMVNILDERCPQMVKFDVFRRVNTGGVPLNQQEVRNVLASPRVRDLLKSMSSCDEFLQATLGRINDIRMGAQELCLRYLTVYDCYEWNTGEIKNYYGLQKSMDAMVLSLAERTDRELEEIQKEFKSVMKQCSTLLGDISFCKPGYHVINKSIFTAWAVVLANMRPEYNRLCYEVNHLREIYLESLQTNLEFYNSITSSTATKKHLRSSIQQIRRILEGCL